MAGFQQILVHPEDSIETKVTFDDPKNSNVWSYIPSTSKKTTYYR